MPDPLDPQALNRYSYVLNNPLRYTDPTGNEPDDDIGLENDSSSQGLPNLIPMGKQENLPGESSPGLISDARDIITFRGGVGPRIRTFLRLIELHPGNPLKFGRFFPGLKKLGNPLGNQIGAVGKGGKGVLRPGDKVFRVFGENNNPLGNSFTRVDPRTVENFRDAAGLPDVNTGRFVLEGTIKNTKGVTTRKALPLNGNKGGLDEVLIPDPKNQIRIDRVSGVNPEF